MHVRKSKPCVMSIFFLFAEHAFDYYCLIMGNVVNNDGISLCCVEDEERMLKRHQVSDIC